jgi:hypothetical protein
VAVNSGGGLVRGNAVNAGHQGGTNEYRVIFDRDVSACVYTATLAADQNGPTLEQPPAGRTTVASDGANVLVNTFAADGSPGELPFHLIPPRRSATAVLVCPSAHASTIRARSAIACGVDG